MAKRRSRNRAAADENERYENGEVDTSDEEVVEDDSPRRRLRGRSAVAGFVEQTMATGEALTVGLVSLAVNTLKAVVYGVVDVAATAVEGVQEIGAQVVGARAAGSQPRHAGESVRARSRRRREAEAADTSEVREAA
jgi:hypothetical protein